VCRARRADRESWGRERLFGALDRHLALRISDVLDAERCASWTRAVYAARAEWTSAFGGEQFSLGRAWYTDFEEDRSREYFAAAATSDAQVERALPGARDFVMGLVAELVGGRVEQRRGWCGPGVHVFPAGQHVALHGGVVHFDTEGLAAHHVAQRLPAISLIVMLQAPETGGGVRVWDVSYAGEDFVDDAELAAPNETLESAAGDLVVLDSYRLHQIQPFSGDRDRISLTAMAAEVDRGRWEIWF
jgi:hypothetical protein